MEETLLEGDGVTTRSERSQGKDSGTGSYHGDLDKAVSLG